jgi:2,3-bisphosphoglycerate-independent phosphoglycerate mutase
MTFILCILDGWGSSDSLHNNRSSGESELSNKYDAIKNAITPNYDNLLENCPHSLLETSGLSVGLPAGQPGNSEVGHITIGAGRVVMQDLPKINNAISDGGYENNEHLTHIISYLRNSEKTCHVLGIASDGGVHGHINHVITTCDILIKNKIKTVVHAFTDGRDTAPKSCKQHLRNIENSGAKIASISGRYFAMDRDKRYERTQKAYNAISLAKAPKFTNYKEFIDSLYANNITDEFIEPHVASFYQGIEEGDVLFFVNYRMDRARQLCESLINPDFKEFPIRNTKLEDVLCMTRYSNESANHSKTIFLSKNILNTLSEVLSKEGKTQLKLAETEKYAHVTYFINAGIENPYKGEERIMIPSPKVATYDLLPSMSSNLLCDKLIDAILSDKYDFICVNFANADMVGHTGNYEAAIKAVEAIDICIGRIIESVRKSDSEVLFTADHGNAEQMMDPTTRQPFTSHTLNKVPFIYFGKRKLTLQFGELSDIAPTILELIDINKPDEMTGKVLFRHS